jgi:hypothetical protein
MPREERRDDRGRGGSSPRGGGGGGGGGGRGFTYRPRSIDTVKQRAARKSGRFDSIYKQGFDNWRPKEGDNLIRFLPPTWDNHEHYGYTLWVHQNIGPDNSTYLCPRKMLNKACPVCEAAAESKAAGEAEEAKNLQPKERVAFWILDRDGEDPDKPLLYDMGWTMDRDITSLTVDERRGEVLMIDDPNKGYDVTIKRYGSGMRTKYSGFAIARGDSPVHDDEKIQDDILDYIMQNPVPETLNYFDYDYLDKLVKGVAPERDPDDGATGGSAGGSRDDSKGERSERSERGGREERGSRRGSRDVEPEPDPTEDPPFDEEADPPPDDRERDRDRGRDRGGDRGRDREPPPERERERDRREPEARSERRRPVDREPEPEPGRGGRDDRRGGGEREERSERRSRRE